MHHNLFGAIKYALLYRAFWYLWHDRQCKILISNCRTIHFPHTHHTHLSLSQSAVCHHSQIAGEISSTYQQAWHYICYLALFIWVITTWHVPLKQAAVEPNGGGLSASQRLPSTNWEPRLTRKFSPSDWHKYLHCSSPACGRQRKESTDNSPALWTCLYEFLWAHLV